MDLPTFTFSLDKIGWEAVSALSGMLIAAAGFAIGYMLRRREKRSQSYTLLAEYRSEIITFSEKFFDTVSEALAVQACSEGSAEDAREFNRLSTKLSSLADTGRFLFPNDLSNDPSYGIKKGPAFAGRRRPPLRAILAAHYCVEAMKRKGGGTQIYLDKALAELNKTGQPLTQPVRETDPVYLLIQSRRCYLNCVLPDTFPREWLSMFSELLGPVTANANPRH